MKKLALLTAAAALAMSIPAIADGVTVFDTENYTLVINKVDFLEDHDGVRSVLLDMTATVKIDEPTSPELTYYLTVYQDNKALDFTYAGTNDHPYAHLNNNQYAKLKNGASEEFYRMYRLTSDSNLEFEFYEYKHFQDYVYVYYDMETGELSTDAPQPETEPDYKQLYEDLLKEYEELKAQIGE